MEVPRLAGNSTSESAEDKRGLRLVVLDFFCCTPVRRMDRLASSVLRPRALLFGQLLDFDRRFDVFLRALLCLSSPRFAAHVLRTSPTARIIGNLFPPALIRLIRNYFQLAAIFYQKKARMFAFHMIFIRVCRVPLSCEFYFESAVV